MVTVTVRALGNLAYFLLNSKELLVRFAVFGLFWSILINDTRCYAHAKRSGTFLDDDGHNKCNIQYVGDLVMGYLALLFLTLWVTTVWIVEIVSMAGLLLFLGILLPFFAIWDAITLPSLVIHYGVLALGSIALYVGVMTYFWGYRFTIAARRVTSFLLHTLDCCLSQVIIFRRPRFRFRPQQRDDGLSGNIEASLCVICEDVVNGSSLLTGSHSIANRPVERRTHQTIEYLRSSAGSCHLCNLLLRSISIETSEVYRRTTDYGAMTIPITNIDASKLNLKIWERRPISREPELRLQITDNDTIGYPIAIEIIPKALNSHERDTNPTTDSTEIMNWARYRIKRCHETHTLCRSEFSTASKNGSEYCPKRLLYIDKNSSLVKLVYRDEVQRTSAHVKYVALSHCWGKDPIDYTLSTDRESQMRGGILSDCLALNFQHAISITRQLGVRYLWIDSLCIRQDSAEDWKIEANDMGRLYANALCVLSTTGSPDAQSGCFSAKEKFIGDCHLRASRRWSLIANLVGDQHSAVSELFRTKVENAPLTRRGWCFQERVLAGRVLHFCKGVVLFECNTLQAASCHAMSKPYLRDSRIGHDGKALVQVGPEPKPPPRPIWPTPSLTLKGGNFIEFETEEFQFPALKIHRPLSNRRWREELYRTYERTVWKTNDNYAFDSYSFGGLQDARQVFQSYKRIATWSPERAVVADTSARIGMRGTFELLMLFKGTTAVEKLTFHDAWYQLVSQYSKRNLTNDGDKLMAISGIANFVEQQTGFRCEHGIWIQDLPFSLLWCVEGKRSSRPVRRMPTWSWTSIDGRVSHRLNRSPRPWNIVDILIDPIYLDRETASTITVSGCAQLPFSSSWMSFSLDVAPPASYGPINPSIEFCCIPILYLEAESTWCQTKDCEIHGLVLRKGESGHYQRIGYFHSNDISAIEDLLNNIDRTKEVRID